MSHDPSPSLRPSACPSLSRIVAARDGGLCRIKLPGGELRAGQALAIAEAVDRHASGVIELTNRANLQLRGVRAGEEAALIEQLVRAGLGPDARFNPIASRQAAQHAPIGDAAQFQAQAAAADDVRNVMVSPTAGRDAQALCDMRPLAYEILALLQSEPRFAALSPKFALLLDGGERLAMIDHPHDIWFSAMPSQAEDCWFALGLAGHPSADHACARAAVHRENLAAFVLASLHTFLDLARPDDARMRQLLVSYGEEAILERIARRVDFPVRRGTDVAAWRRADVDPTLRFGARRQRDRDLWHVGGQPPLGRIDAPTLRALARLALEYGDGTLRVTPWQSVLLTDVKEPSIARVEADFGALGLVLDPAVPFARLIACAGSTGCAKSFTDTKADATSLARQLPVGAEVHLSGCKRSCAAAHSVPFTLLAVETGRYDVYWRHDAQEERDDSTHRFGRRIAARLTIEQAARLLGEVAARSPSHA